MNIEIREANLQDYINIQKLNEQELGYCYPTNKTKEVLQNILKSQEDKVYVAVLDRQVVGYIHGSNYDTLYFGHMKNIMGIAVDRNYQSRGIGSKLIQAIESWAIKENALGVRLVSSNNRKQAHAFYHKQGYHGGKEQLNFKKIF